MRKAREEKKKGRNVHSISRPRETTEKNSFLAQVCVFEYPPLASHLPLVAHIMPKEKKKKNKRRPTIGKIKEKKKKR